jgi:hypothetical protein
MTAVTTVARSCRVKIRLMGTRAECAAAVDLLRAASAFGVTSVSRPYPSRRDPAQVRLYLTCDLLEPGREGDQNK